MKPNLTTWLWATVAAFLLSCTWMLDGPSETETAQDIQDDLVTAIATAKGVR